jgi:hypothetical protein
MPGSSNLSYILAAVTALALGLGASFWRSAAENKSLIRANLTASIAFEAAQDEVKVLREKLSREIQARGFAEAAQTVAETSERSVRDKLMQETKAKRAAEAQLQTAAAKLVEEAKARDAADKANVRIVATLEAANADLAQEREARQAAELRRDEAAGSIAGLTVKLNEEIAAGNAAQEALVEEEGQVRVLRAKLAGQMAAGENAVGWRTQSVSPAAVARLRRSRTKPRIRQAAILPPVPGMFQIRRPASLAARKPEARPAPRAAPLIQANGNSRRPAGVQ